MKLGELEKRIKYVSFSHFKVNSPEVNHELSRLENLKSCFDIKARDRRTLSADWLVVFFKTVVRRSLMKGTMVDCSNSTKRSLVYQADGIEFKAGLDGQVSMMAYNL